jgi:hypothetical protein
VLCGAWGGGVIGDWDGGDERVGARDEEVSAVGAGKFWVTHLFTVRYPNQTMCLAFGIRLLETVLPDSNSCHDELFSVLETKYGL